MTTISNPIYNFTSNSLIFQILKSYSVSSHYDFFQYLTVPKPYIFFQVINLPSKMQINT